MRYLRGEIKKTTMFVTVLHKKDSPDSLAKAPVVLYCFYLGQNGGFGRGN